MEHPIDESAWRRGWNDTKTAWKSLLFIILDAVVCVLVGSIFEWYWGLGLFVFAMLCAWIGATASAPVRQRNEAREQVRKLKESRELKGCADDFIWDGWENLQKLELYKSHNLPIQEHELSLYHDWFKSVSDWLNKDINSEVVNWFTVVDIGQIKPTMDNIIDSYESGIAFLKGIKKTIGLAADKEGSRN